MRKNPLSAALSGAFRPFYEAPMREQAEAVSRGMQRIEQQRKAEIITKPMRALFDLLLSGEVDEIDGKVVMDMPDYDYRSDFRISMSPVQTRVIPKAASEAEKQTIKSI